MMSERDVPLARLFRVAVVIFAAVCVPLSAQTTPNTTAALNWLAANQKADGTWGEFRDLAPRDTAHVVLVQSLYRSTDPSVARGYAWLISQRALAGNQFLAEQAKALVVGGQDASWALDRLLLQRTGADFGGFADHTADSYDAALALQALVADEPRYTTAIASTLTQLVVRQNADGGWGIDRGFDSNPIITAEVLTALSLLRTQLPPQAVIAAAQTYLAARRQADGSYGSSALETALSYRALALSGYALSAISPQTLAYLAFTQGAEGSWSDIYTTARVLEALTVNKPNLVIHDTDVTLTPSTVVDGGLVTAVVKVTNSGIATTGRSCIFQLRLGSTKGIQVNPTGIGIPTLVPGASTTLTIQFNATSMVGRQTIFAVADTQGEIDELREDDNSGSAALTVTGKPDLTLFGSDIATNPARLQPNQTGTLQVTIHNAGQGDASTAGYAVYESFGGVETLLTKSSFPSIAAGSSAVTTLPVTWATGSHTVRVVADPDALVSETNETNNTVSTPFVVSPIANVDLRVNSVTVTPPAATAGQTITVTAVIENTGNQPVTSKAGFMDGVPGAGGGYYSNAPISVDAQTSITLQSTHIVGPNTRVIYVVADPERSLTEIDETNNQAFASLTSSFVDLTVDRDGVVVPRLPMAEGQTVTFRAVVRNKGTLPADNVEVLLYDDVPERGGVVIAGRTVSVPAAGKAVVSGTVTLRSGQRFATVSVNPTHTAAEIDFSNNVASRFYAVAGTDNDIRLASWNSSRTEVIDSSGMTVDSANLTISGIARIMVNANLNNPRPFTVAVFDDADGDLAFNSQVDTLLGSATFQTGVSTQWVQIPLQGTIRFAPGHPVAYLDSGNAVGESNEGNNFVDLIQACETAVVRSPVPYFKWHSTLTSSRFSPVARLMDTNGDDVVDENDAPFVVVTAGGSVSVLRGSNGQVVWSQTPDWSGAQIAPVIADVDGDGKPEIIAHLSNTVTHYLVCYNAADGTTKWVSPYPGLDRDPEWDTWLAAVPSLTYRYVGMPVVADLDGDGRPEVITGRTCLNGADGTVKWVGTGASGRVWQVSNPSAYLSNADMEAPIAVDLNGDGNLEVVAGRTAYRPDGTILWNRTDLPDGFTSAYIPSDNVPRIVLVANGNIWLLRGTTGATMWGPIAVPGGGTFGGPATIFMNGANGPYIGVAGDTKYSVFAAEAGTLVWSVSPLANAANATPLTVNAATAFDFGTGMRLVYPARDRLVILDAGNGSLVQEVPIQVNPTVPGSPAVADVDDDGHADIVVPDISQGVAVLSNDTWYDAPSIFNEAAYHGSNVSNEMAAIPVREVLTAFSRFHYRSNMSTPSPTTAPQPNLVAGFVRADTTHYPLFVNLTVRVGNNGWSAAEAPRLSFYSVSGTSNTLIGTVTASTIPAGAYRDVTYTINNPSLGSSTYFAVADDPATIAECNESDNRSANLQVAISADIAIDPISLAVSDTHPQPGTTVNFTASARLIGPIDATVLKAQYFLGNPASGGTAISPLLVPIVSESGSTRVATANFSTVVNAADGSYTIYVVFDPAGVIGEDDETNNSGTIPITVTSVPTADVATTDARLAVSDPQPRPSDTIQLGATAALSGSFDTTLLTGQFFLGDPAAGGRPISAALPVQITTSSSFRTAAISASWVVDTGEGPQTLYALFDPGNVIAEVDETNNRAMTTINVTTPQIIKSLSGSIALTPPSAEAATPIRAGVLVQNIGNVTQTNVVLNYVVTGGSGSGFSGSATLSSIAKNEYVEVTLGTFTPVADGTYTITVTAADPGVTFAVSPKTIKIAPFATAVNVTAVPSRVPVSLPLVQCHTKVSRTNTVVVSDDPLMPVIRSSIEKGLGWQTPALNAYLSPVCFKCHIGAHGMVSFELSRRINGVTVDPLTEETLFNNTVAMQQPDGAFVSGYVGTYNQTTAALGAWAISFWKDMNAARPYLLKSADSLVSYQVSNPLSTGYGAVPCNDCRFPVDETTMMAMVAWARSYELTHDQRYLDAINAGVTYALRYDYLSTRLTGPEGAARISLALSAALPLLTDASRIDLVKQRIAAITDFLKSQQNPDGSFGVLSSPPVPIMRTAQCLYALATAGVPGSDPALRAAILWLINKQQLNGAWSENPSDGAFQERWMQETTWAMIALPAAFLRFGQFDADLKLFLPSPAAVATSNLPLFSSRAVTGGTEVQWRFTSLDEAGADLFFNVSLNGLQNGEVRPVAGSAVLSYNDPFSGQQVTRTLSVPSVTGVAPLDTTLTTDKTSYGPNETVTLTEAIANAGATVDGITNDLIVRDANGATVATIAAADPVAGLPASPFPGWHYSLPVTVPMTRNGVHRVAMLPVDFGQKLAAAGLTGTLDANSIRVTADSAPAAELVFSWVPAATPSAGTLLVTIPDSIASGSTFAGHVFFDTLQNGFKPASMFDRGAGANGGGLTANYYQIVGGTGSLPSTLVLAQPPLATTTLLNTAPYSAVPPGVPASMFAQVWTGAFMAPVTGIYGFTLVSDDGSWLEIDGTMVINNGGGHAPLAVTRALTLTAGLHSIRVTGYQAFGGYTLYLLWSIGASGYVPIPTAYLYDSEPGATAGGTVGALEILPNGTVTKTYQWTTGATAAGTYTAVASLRQFGAFVGSASAPFTINPAADLQLSVATDRAAYDPGDTVHINSTILFASGNTTQQNLTATVSVLDASGAVAGGPAARPLPPLVAGQSATVSFDWSVGSAAPGLYNADVKVTNASGATVVTKRVPFTVRSTAQNGFGITGTVSVNGTSYSGLPVSYTVSITNGGNAAITGAPFAIHIVDASQTPLSAVSFTATAAQGQTTTVTVTGPADVIPPGTYQVVLTSLISGAPVTLGTATIQIKVRPQTSASAATDKTSYDINETAHVTGSVQVTAGDTTLTTLSAVTSILDPNGITVASRTDAIPSLAPAASATVTLDWAVGVAAPGTYTARFVVTDTAGIAIGSQAQTQFTVTSTAVTGKGITGQLSAPASVYIGDPINFAAAITDSGNAGLTNAPFAVQFAGNNLSFTVTVAIGATSTTNLTQATAAVAPGSYTATLVSLITGTPVPLATATVQVKPRPQTSASVATDRSGYDVNDTVHVTGTIQLTGGDAALTTLSATTSIVDPNGSTIATSTTAIDSLAPNASMTLTFDWPAGVNAPGVYTVNFAVNDAAGVAIGSQATVQFTVVSTAVSGKGIGGRLTAPASVYVGDTIHFSAAVTDEGNAALANKPFAVQFAGGELPFNVTVAMGATSTTTLTQSTAGVAPGTYTATLVSLITGAPVTLATSTLQVKPRPQTAATVTTDKATYDVFDTVHVSGTVQLTAGDTTVTTLSATTSILDPNGNPLASYTNDIPSLAPGASANLAIDWPAGVNAPGTYTAKLVVTDRSGVAVGSQATSTFIITSTAVSGKGITGQLTASTAVYSGDTISFTVVVTDNGNAALTDKPFAIQFAGSSLPFSVTVAMGATSTANLTASTSGLAAGSYTATLVSLITGTPVTLATATVQVTTRYQTATSIATDRTSYDINQTVHVTGTVQLTAGDGAVTTLSATTTILDPNGTAVATSTTAIASLAPGASTTLTLDWPAGISAPGLYTTKLVVTDTAGVATPSQATVQFTVTSTAVTGKGITGTIATEASVIQGTPLPITVTITNNGNAPLVNKPFDVRIGGDTLSFTADVAMGATVTQHLTEPTPALAAQTYTATLESMITGTPVPLATTSFTVIVQAPSVVSFVATPPAISAGQQTTLSWTTENATSVSITGVGTTQPPAGSLLVSPATTTTYVLTATGVSGTATASITVTVRPSAPSSITANFNGTAIAAGRSIWFNAPFKVSGLQAAKTTIYVTSQTITFTANGTTYTLTPPDSQVTFHDPGVTDPRTHFDPATNTLKTSLPAGPLSGNTLHSAFSFPVPAGGLPGGIKNVTWSARFATDSPAALSVNWQWAAAVYTTFSSDYNALGIKPVDVSIPLVPNSDHAGTPENFKSFVTGGATGGGGSNYTGGYSGTASVAVPAGQ